MGCADLWRRLAAEGLIESLKGGTRGDYERILKELQGKTLAVDCAVWMMEVKSLTQLRKSFPSETAAFLKVFLEKISNMIRLGCTPVLIFEGEIDKSKYELMERRYKRTYTKKMHRQRYTELEKFAAALGLIAIRAPGEGEAMCAALDALGLVDGCVTRDADAFAFGAQTVYKTLSISARVVRNNEMEISRLSAARTLFGICSGGTCAMRLMMLLSGGDYNLGGTHNVGSVKALATVQSLLKNKLDDLELIDDFWATLFTKEEPAEPAPSRSCSGCRTCGCPVASSKRLDHHGKAGCVGCGTHSTDQGGTGAGGCVPMTEDESCQCPFCLWKRGDEGKRDLMSKVFDNARRQSINHTTLDNALKTYERQKDLAVQKARFFSHKSELGWQHRPDMDVLEELLGKYLDWDAVYVREKLMPLLLDWDATHRRDPDREFEVSEVLSLGTRGRQLGNQTSEITVRFTRRADVHVEMRARDELWLKDKADGGKWSLRKSLIDAHYTDLVKTFKKKRGGAKTAEPASRKITDFFKGAPPKAAAPSDAPGTESREVATPSKVAKLSAAQETPRALPSCLSSEKKRVVDYATTLMTPRRRPWAVSSIYRKRRCVGYTDIQPLCAPVNTSQDTSLDLSSALGSVPRRLTSLTITSPAGTTPPEIQDNWPAEPPSPRAAVPEIEEEVDLLTPRTNPPDDDGVIDLLSEPSPSTLR